MAKKRVKSDVLPGIPFEFDFYMVYWEDIQSDSCWRTLKEIQKSKPAICVSTGWLVKENRDVHILMSDYNYDEHNELSDCLLYTSPSPRDVEESRMPSSA